MTTNSVWGDEPPDTTPLAPEDLEQLLPTDVATRSDLNAVERDNILAARLWAFAQSPITTVDALLQLTTIDGLHRRMFGNVWKWAGKRRTRVTNIGVDPPQIVPQLHDALQDAKYWHDNAVFGPVERAVRLHHRLVSIHAYVNGNGRHARFVADLYLHIIGHKPLQWKPDESEVSESRAAYIAAVQAADAGDYSLLIAYASS